jgi:hypothetical protein
MFDFFTPYLISTHTTGMPQLKILFLCYEKVNWHSNSEKFNSPCCVVCLGAYKLVITTCNKNQEKN